VVNSEPIHNRITPADNPFWKRQLSFLRPLSTRLRGIRFRHILLGIAVALALAWTLACITFIALRWIDPPTTAVQMQRRFQSLIHGTPYHKHYRFIPLRDISPELQHAVVAAEDARFFQHHGFDWHEIQIAAEDDLEGTRSRGASTITQQLVKNLFFGTGRSYLRKGAEFVLVPVAELVLTKQRILELYLNLVEWGPGIYGADAAARYHYQTPARNLNRDQSARLAAILPSPLRRRPARMTHSSTLIQERMRQMGW